MTQYIYIASPMRLPTGSFGLNPVSPEQPNVFKTELDFTHLYFENNYNSEKKARFTYSAHFSFKHQVAASHNFLPLKYQVNGNSMEEKCLTLLYSYLEEAVQASGIIEYFTSLNGKEYLPISHKRSIRWADIKTSYDLVMEDLEFWEITL
ncbi:MULTISPECIES: hypothetical protein [Bacillus]|uniref:Uncharacterized protein n=2 Tax=Bacillus TaxID=1386 RepID=A0A0M4FTL2_9BACI|nr:MULTISPECIES: hypothetical protein [Bacillus]ALC83059.1 hypothetical protein AM592_16880 [Bacillus gobiensis]MBP1082102.1 hypothetical protein [Bacillus capparidis]MED1096726.1 hypothetical protein [Bacillus capparidis]